MKKLLTENIKTIIISITIIVSSIIIAKVGFSYAIINENGEIYTRDELSEKITNLEEENALLKKKGSSVKLEKQANVDENWTIGVKKTLSSIVYSPTSYDTDLFTVENAKIIINKSGYYEIELFTDVAFTEIISGTRVISGISINDGILLENVVVPAYTRVSESNFEKTIFFIGQNSSLGLYATPYYGNLYLSQITMTVKYLGD